MADYERRLTKLEEARGLTGGVHVVEMYWDLDADESAHKAEMERALRENPAPAGTSLTVFIKRFFPVNA